MTTKLKIFKVSYLKRLPFVLSKKEKFAFWAFFVLFLSSLFLLFFGFYYSFTKVVPAFGGVLKEGMIGQPRFINPVYAEANEVDKTLTSLIYSSITKYDKEGKIVYDLAKNIEIEQGGKVYIVELRNDVKFHDGKKLTADDILFTVQTIQNPDFKSPLFIKWEGVKVEKISDYKIKFTLKNPYPGFLETLTLPILPKHIWQDINYQNFPLSPYNFKPIGSGPYKFVSLKQNKEGFIENFVLEANKDYYSTLPHIARIEFHFFKDAPQLLSAAKSQEINSYSLELKEENLPGVKLFRFKTPRVFLLFFNQEKNDFLKNKNIRKALAFLVNKEKIVQEVFKNEAEITNSPFLDNFFNLEVKEKISYNPQKTEEILKKEGFVKENGIWGKRTQRETMKFTRNLSFGSTGKEVENLQKCLAKFPDIYPEGEITGYFGEKTKKAVERFQEKYKEDILIPAGLSEPNGKVRKLTREKLNEVCVISEGKFEPLEFTLTTSDDKVLQLIAKNLTDEWQNFGIKVNLEILPLQEIREKIKERDYQAFLFGEILTLIPDPFPFWHSTQADYPGLNLAGYKNKNLDKILEQLKKEENSQKRKELLEKAQEIILEDLPAIPLVNPYYLYYLPANIGGVKEGIIPEASQRFSDITNWYLRTKRSF